LPPVTVVAAMTGVSAEEAAITIAIAMRKRLRIVEIIEKGVT